MLRNALNDFLIAVSGAAALLDEATALHATRCVQKQNTLNIAPPVPVRTKLYDNEQKLNFMITNKNFMITFKDFMFRNFNMRMYCRESVSMCSEA